MLHPDRTVLFICTGNYYRSRYAEHYFNARAPRTLGWVADSRGFEPSPLNPGPISRDAARRLSERSVAPEQYRAPLRLHEQDLARAALVIVLDEDEHRPYMRERFPSWENRVSYWRVADVWGMTVDEALGLIEREIERLIGALPSGG